MAMFLLDGYNVMYSHGIENRDYFVDAVERFCRRRDKKAKIIFDGFSREIYDVFLTDVEFVGNADVRIVEILESTETPSMLTLVTDDKELLWHARKNKINTITSEKFRLEDDEIGADYQSDLYVSDEDAAAQLREFNFFKNKNKGSD